MINQQNYESYMIQHVDKELSAEKEQELKDFLKIHPQLQHELLLLERTKLKPDLAVVLENKSTYHKRTGISLKPGKGLVAGIVIVVILAGVGFGVKYMIQSGIFNRKPSVTDTAVQAAPMIADTTRPAPAPTVTAVPAADTSHPVAVQSNGAAMMPTADTVVHKSKIKITDSLRKARKAAKQAAQPTSETAAPQASEPVAMPAPQTAPVEKKKTIAPVITDTPTPTAADTTKHKKHRGFLGLGRKKKDGE